MQNKKALKDNLTLLRKRAEKTLQARPVNNLESAELSSEEMYSLLSLIKKTKISLKTGNNDIVLKLDSAIGCGLIINELITNSLKYAFPEDRKGEIRVAFGYLGDGRLEMRVSDDGVGMPPNFDFRDGDTLGLKIVNALAEQQLGGTIVLDCTKGTKFFIRFKELPHKGIV